MAICKPEFFTIVKGEDRTLPLRVTNSDGTSYNLSTTTEIRARFRKADGSSLEQRLTLAEITIIDAINGRLAVTLSEDDSNTLLVAERQDFSVIFDKGPLASIIYGAHTYSADHPGADGNTIVLVFDGIKTAAVVVAAWNASHVDLQVKITAGVPTAVPAVGTIQLVGGIGGRRKVNYSRAITVQKQAT